MKQIVPNYYEKFKCIAGACRHNCCVGWEIEIDKDTHSLYCRVPDSFGERLKEGISRENIPHFILDEKGRCPFLNRDNLCDIITVLGENALCQVCNDHPRFRNYFDDRTEVGLGLCCEAAGQLILGQKEKMTLSGIEPNGHFFTLRKQIFDQLQNRDQSMDERLKSLCSINKSPALLATLYRSLERLDPAWDLYLDRLERIDSFPSPTPEWDLPLEQLAVYFVYRHLAGAMEDGLLKERIAFAVLSTRMIHALSDSPIELVEIARMYSSEIEYSDINIDVILKGITV